MDPISRHAKLRISKPNVRYEERVSSGHCTPAELLLCHEIDSVNDIRDQSQSHAPDTPLHWRLLRADNPLLRYHRKPSDVRRAPSGSCLSTALAVSMMAGLNSMSCPARRAIHAEKLRLLREPAPRMKIRTRPVETQ